MPQYQTHFAEDERFLPAIRYSLAIILMTKLDMAAEDLGMRLIFSLP